MNNQDDDDDPFYDNLKYSVDEDYDPYYGDDDIYDPFEAPSTSAAAVEEVITGDQLLARDAIQIEQHKNKNDDFIKNRELYIQNHVDQTHQSGLRAQHGLFETSVGTALVPTDPALAILRQLIRESRERAAQGIDDENCESTQLKKQIEDLRWQHHGDTALRNQNTRNF
mmetsp:Transcript_3490/g.5326  ORF Transcript_3490/g.5326 Transcript_3490/m.5326 type:complete len:169 (+) Transcript_3490:114-620(+)